MNVVITATAEVDIERIADRIAMDSPRRALTVVQALRGCCEDLAIFPPRFPLVPQYADLGVRRRVHGNYLIFYRAGPENIEIVHVLHGAMNYEALLFPDG